MSRRLPLVVLAAAAILPILLFSAGMIVLFDRQQQAAVERGLRQTARSTIGVIEQKIADDIATLTALAAAPAIEAGDMIRFESHLARVLRAEDRWLSARLFEAGSLRAVAMTSVNPAGLPLADEALLRRAAETRQAQIGNLDSGPDRQYVVLVVPVIRDSQVTHLLAASTGVAGYSDVLQNQGFDPDWTVAVLDREHVILARNRAAGDYVGTSATPSLTQEIERRRAHFFFSLNKEGARVYTAFITSDWTGWTAAIGVPEAAVKGPQRRMTLALLGGGSGALALGLLLAGIVIRNLGQRQEAERRLIELETQQTLDRRLTDIAANLPGIIYRRVLHPDGRISHPYVSDGLGHLTDRLEDKDKRLDLEAFAEQLLAPGDRERWQAVLANATRSLEPYHIEARLTAQDSSVRWIHSAARPHRLPDGTIVWDGVVLDITDLKEAEERLASSLAEKETLLREIHHRVRNNLQVISSLLQLEVRQFNDPDARERVNRISQRIAVLGRIHDQLYASENFARIDFARHLEQLCTSLRELYAQPGPATIELKAERLYCDLETAIPLGLIANELVTNSLKHGSADGRQARVRVTLSKAADGTSATLTVADESGAAPAQPLPATSGGLGMRIVKALVAQINAEIAIDTASGWRVIVTLPGERLSR